MISAFNHRLLLIEQALSNNGAVLAQLQLLELDSKPGVDASSQSDYDESELDRLRDWVVRLRAQVARTERRIERLRASVERHDVLLSDIKSRIIWSSAGCAVVRPHSRWSARTDSSGAQRQAVAATKVGLPVNGKWSLAVQLPHRKLSIAHTTPGGGSSWSARNTVYSGARGVTPQLSQSFTSLKRHRQQSDVRVSAQATSSHDNRSFDVLRDNMQRSSTN